jgi:hypothetical protein
VAFVSIDLDLYSASKEALALLDADPAKLLPRVFCYFDDIMGHGYNDFTGDGWPFTSLMPSIACGNCLPFTA